MAKLNGVRTIDMVNGEITKIAYDGAEYELFEGSPQVGDLIRPHSDEWYGVPDGFYLCNALDGDGDAEISTHVDDEDGHFRRHYDVFRKVNADTTPALADRVTALEGRVDALEGAGDSLKVGDYITIDTSEYDDDITEGKAYEVMADSDGDLFFYDDDDYRRYSPISDESYTKVSVPVAPAKPVYKTEKRHAKVGERILIVDATATGGKYANGDVLTVKDDSAGFRSGSIQPEGIFHLVYASEYEVIVEDAQTITHNGAEYTLVDRKAQPGDVVVFTETGGQLLRSHTQYEVLPGMFVKGDDRKTEVYKSWLGRTEANTLVYAPKATPKPKTGDIVVITANTNSSRNEVGDIGKVGEKEWNGWYEVHVPSKPVTALANGNYTKPDEMRLATPAEIAQYEAAVKEAEKPKLQAGDYVFINASKTFALWRYKAGDIAKVTRFRDDGYIFVQAEGKPEEHMHPTQVRKATDAEVAKAKSPKLKTGDIMAVKDGVDSYFEDLNTLGTIVKITSTDSSVRYSIRAELLDGSDYDYFRPQDLELVDAETAQKAALFAKIGRKVGEFKKGDIVRVLDAMSTVYLNAGQFTEVAEPDGSNEPLVRSNDGGTRYAHVELVTPVESRADRK